MTQNARALIPTDQIQVQVNRGYFFEDEEKAKLGKSWPKNAATQCAEAITTDLHDALTRSFPHPAYLVGHEPTDINRRLSKDVLLQPEFLDAIGGAVRMHLMIADVDNHGLAPSAVEEWFELEREKIDALLAEHPGTLVYRSQGGYRLLAALPAPIEITDAATDLAWKLLTFQWVAYLSRVFGIKVDPLHDFTRYQRVPHDTRKKGAAPDQLEVIGDVRAIGLWMPKLTAADLEDAKARAKNPTGKASSKRPAPNQGPARMAGAPTLFRVMMRNRGLLGAYDNAGGFFTCVCPAEHEHSSPNDDPNGDDTVLYENDGKDWGGFNCLHSNCGHEARKGDAKFWQSYFSKYEIDAAKEECGMTKTNSCTPRATREILPDSHSPDSDFEQPVPRTDEGDYIPDADIDIKELAPPIVPEAGAKDIPKAPEFQCSITVIPVKDSKADPTLADLILKQTERYIGKLIAEKADHDVHTKLYAYSDGYFRQLPPAWLFDCIEQYEGAVTIGDKMACKQSNTGKGSGEKAAISDEDKWHANPRNIGAVTKCLTLKSISRQRLAPNETFFGSAPGSAVFKNGSLVWLESERRFVWTNHSPVHRARYRHEVDFAPGLVPQHTVATLTYSLRGQTPEETAKCVEVLRCAMGVALLGCYKLVKRSVWNLGRGRDGKGLYAEILRAILPEGIHTNVQPASLGNKVVGGSSAMRLLGARVNVVSEIQGAGESTSALKAALVCEPIETRAMGKDADGGVSTAEWIVDSNYPLPRVEVDAAWRDRWIMVRFPFQVPERYRVAELGLRLAKLEYREIVCWAIEGALDLIANGGRYDVPACHAEVMAAWAAGAGTSNVAAFVEDMVNEGKLQPGARGKPVVSLKALYGTPPKGDEPGDGYRAWLHQNGYQARESVNRRTFKAELQTLKGVRVPTRQGQDWVVVDDDYVRPLKTAAAPSSGPRLRHSVDFSKHETVSEFRAETAPARPVAPPGIYDHMSAGFEDGIPGGSASSEEHEADPDPDYEPIPF